jgi:hypothetical protein
MCARCAGAQVDPKFQRPGASRLAAALEGLASSGSDGHLIARSASGRPNFGGAAGAAAAAAAADAVRLVASAKRVGKPAAELVRGRAPARRAVGRRARPPASTCGRQRAASALSAPEPTTRGPPACQVGHTTTLPAAWRASQVWHQRVQPSSHNTIQVIGNGA